MWIPPHGKAREWLHRAGGTGPGMCTSHYPPARPRHRDRVGTGTSGKGWLESHSVCTYRQQQLSHTLNLKASLPPPKKKQEIQNFRGRYVCDFPWLRQFSPPSLCGFWGGGVGWCLHPHRPPVTMQGPDGCAPSFFAPQTILFAMCIPSIPTVPTAVPAVPQHARYADHCLQFNPNCIVPLNGTEASTCIETL